MIFYSFHISGGNYIPPPTRVKAYCLHSESETSLLLAFGQGKIFQTPHKRKFEEDGYRLVQGNNPIHIPFSHPHSRSGTRSNRFLDLVIHCGKFTVRIGNANAIEIPFCHDISSFHPFMFWRGIISPALQEFNPSSCIRRVQLSQCMTRKISDAVGNKTFEVKCFYDSYRYHETIPSGECCNDLCKDFDP